MRQRMGLLTVAVCTIALAAWWHSSTKAAPPNAAGGDAAAGRQAIVEFGCGTCHTIPGVTGANGLVGPPLTDFASRATIAGELPNTASQLERWITSPQTVEPTTDMPDMGVPQAAARDIATYLYTLGPRLTTYHVAG